MWMYGPKVSVAFALVEPPMEFDRVMVATVPSVFRVYEEIVVPAARVAVPAEMVTDWPALTQSKDPEVGVLTTACAAVAVTPASVVFRESSLSRKSQLRMICQSAYPRRRASFA